jgi:pimeloyl-ACP methyl ester carboxylesterase
VNGINLVYFEQGRGKAVVFVHGAVGDYRSWEQVREPIAKQYRYIAITLRYFGGDPWGDDGAKFSLQTHADDLAEFIRGLNVGPVDLVGWSYGGGAVLVLAAQHPELVASAFLYEPALQTIVSGEATVKALKEDAGAAFGPVFTDLKAGDDDAAVRHLIDGVDGQPGLFDSLPAEARAQTLSNARTMPLLFRTPPPAVTCDQLSRIQVPVMVVRGELTRPFFRLIAEAASRCIPGSRLVVAPNTRHLWPVQQPAAFDEELLKFLSRR